MSRIRTPRCLVALLALLLAAVSFAMPLAAQERILAYDSEIDIRADAGLDVTERITVRAEGQQIRRGIYRDFPTRYKDRHGNRVVVDFDMVEVLRDGKPEPWFTERLANGVRINTGNDDVLPVPATYTYTLRYRTTRQLGFFDAHDELYWNAIGTGWAFPIEAGSVLARLPEPVPVERLHAEGYTGAQGERQQHYTAILPAPGTARWELTRPLGAQAGFTVVLTFPKGIVAAPTGAQRAWWLLKDNRGVLLSLLTLAVLVGYCVRRWRQVGRDPAPGVVIARYEPPEGHSPGALRYLRRMGYDTRCFSADVLSLAVAGALRIERDKGFLSDDWTLHQTSVPGKGSLPEPPRLLQASLFANGAKVELEKRNATRLQAVHAAHEKALRQRFQPEYFQRNGGSIGIAIAIAVIGTIIAAATSGGAGVLLMVALSFLMVIVVIAFGILVKAPTVAGRKLLDEIEGLKLYLGVAEREELARMPGPDAPPVLDAQRYEQLLPYAVALEVEDAWTEKFTAAVGASAAAAAASSIAWYHGGGAGDLGSLSSALGNSLSSQIASSSTPPGSSSGSGGGGSSGGGGGGGGGGGR
jgi:uncharacterized membrane protein YgcG